MKTHFRSSTVSRAGAVAAMAASLVAASLVAAPAAQAIDHPDYTNQGYWTGTVLPAVAAGTSYDLGDLIITLKPGALATDEFPIASVQTAPDAQPLPAGMTWRNAAELWFWDGRNDLAYPSTIAPSTPAAIHRGWASFPFSYTDTAENHIAGGRFISSRLSSTASGYFRFVIGFDTTGTGNLRPGQPGSAFYDGLLYVDKTTNALSVVSDGGSSDKTETTTSLAESGTTATSTTLTATVTPAATGSVVFKQNGTQIGQATVTDGVATYEVTNLAPSTAYSFTAEYSGDTTHEASVSTERSVTTLPQEPAEEPADESDSDVTVTVPEVDDAVPSGLKITTKPATSLSLTGTTPTRTAGQAWTATGQLGDVTVTDDRQDAADGDWNLNGALAGPFTTTGGTGTIAPAQFSWTPEKVAGAGDAGTAGDLGSERKLASGSSSDQANVTTTVKAGLSLNVPAETPAGDYKATLTLTLI